MSGRDNRGSGHQPLSNAMGKIKDRLSRVSKKLWTIYNI